MRTRLEPAIDLVSSSVPEIRIHLFGQMEATLSGGEVAKVPSRRSLWVLAILALRKGRPIERQTLAGMVWPDSSDAGALHNLRQTLAGLRRALGAAGELIETVSPRSIALRAGPELWVDVVEFDAAAAEGNLPSLERALELYRGPLCAGWDDPFAREEREAREQSFVASAETLAGHYALQKDHRRAADVLRRAITVDPYRESACRALMKSLAESGEAAAALEMYRTLRLNLRRDLNSEPDPETVHLYKAIRNGAGGQPTGKGAPAPRESGMPVPLSSLLGRKAEIKEVASLLERCRLVTLSGVGGVGKTRLAIAVAEAVGDKFPDGTRFVDLAPVQDPARIPSALAAALDVEEQAGRPLLDTVSEKLKTQELLLVVDNCEHLIQGVAEVLDTLLSAGPRIHVLATSRQSIAVAGEFVFRVPSLSTPQPLSGPGDLGNQEERTQHLLSSEAVRLFIDRMRRGGSPGALSSAELEAIGSICRRLDGIPLAIELAAARTKALSPAEIEARLENQFALLSGGTRSLARHQTLRAAIDWSWALLTEAERSLMIRLCVFRGGWTLEAAEAVSSGRADSASALDLIEGLIDRSLLYATRDPDGTRFAMLESIRQYADERLRETSRWELVFDSHRDFFLKWAEETKAKQHGTEQTFWFRRCEADHDNCRAALEWCRARGEAGLRLRLAVALARFWDTHGHVQEGRSILESCLEQPGSAPPFVVAEAYGHTGWMAKVQGDFHKAREHYRSSLRIFREIDAEPHVAGMLNLLAGATYYLGDYDQARSQYEEAFAIYQKIGLHGGSATVLNNLAEMELYLDDCDAARSYLERSIAQIGSLDAGIPQRRGLVFGNLSVADLRQGKYEDARTNAAKSLRVYRDNGIVVAVPGALNQMAIVAARREEWDLAAKLLGASESLAASQGIPLENLVARERAEAIAAVQEALGPAQFHSEFTAGKGMTMDDSIALALAQAPAT